MSIMDIFKSAPATPPATNQPDAKTNLSDSPPSTGPDGKMPGTDPGMENPLDVYKKMFDTANNASEEAPKFSLDPKVLGDVSKKMDFTRGVSPELLQKATNGDVSSLMEIIKTVGQNSYRASIEHNTALTDTYINSRSDFDKKTMEKGVKQQLTTSALADTPNYQHPVIKAELNRIASQYAAANPDAAPQDVAKAAKQYIDDLQSALNPKATAPKAGEEGGEMDWSKYLS